MVEGISYIIYLIVMLPLMLSFFIAFISIILGILNFLLSYLGANDNPLIIYNDDIQSLIQKRFYSK
jgi:predicted membrane metal-binding protein